MIKMVLLGACALIGLTATAFAESKLVTPDVPAAFKPAQREGYIFVGGRYETADGKELATGQMYVQFHASLRLRSPSRS